MFCPNCGANNADTATVCVQCSQPVRQFSSAPQTPQPSPVGMPVPAQPQVQVPNYQTQSIIMVVASALCCTLFSLPFAILALINSNQVKNKLAANDIAGALAASKNAKMFNWISFGVVMAGTLFMIVYVILIAIGAATNIFQR